MPTVKKSKGGVQDLLLGKGTVNQVRAGGTYPIDKLDVPVTVDSVAEMQALDVDAYTRARVYYSTTSFDDYIYDGSDTSGVSSATGTGTWYRVRQNTDVVTIADLRLLEPSVDGQRISLLGHTDPGLGGGTFYYDAKDTASADNNGTIIVTSGEKRWKRLKVEGRSFSVQDFGALGKGAGFPDSAAFQNAANAGDFHIPSCDKYYLVGGLNIPTDTIVTGERVVKYTVFSLAEIVGANAVVYDTTEPTFITWGRNCSASKCTFYGVNKSRGFFDVGSNPNDFRMFQCESFGFLYGMGRHDGGGAGTIQMLQCHFSGNRIGMNALIDSHAMLCEINANDEDGVALGNGSNGNVFTDCRVEFNNTKGYNIFGGTVWNIITGGQIDRNGHAGISITGTADLIASNLHLTRNGRFAKLLPEQDTHIAITGGVSDNLMLSNITTTSGVDDNGGGYHSPSFGICASNNASGAGSIVNCDLTGTTGNTLNARTGGSFSCPIFHANTITTRGAGFSLGAGRSNSGPVYFPNEVVFSGITGNYSAAEDFIMTGLPVTDSFSRTGYDLFLVTRNGSTGGTVVQRYILTVEREGGNATVRLDDYILSSANPVITVAVNADGTEVTVTMTPSSGTLRTEAVLTYFR